MAAPSGGLARPAHASPALVVSRQAPVETRYQRRYPGVWRADGRVITIMTDSAGAVFDLDELAI